MKYINIFLILIIMFSILFSIDKHPDTTDIQKSKIEKEKDSIYFNFYYKERRKLFEIIKRDIELFNVTDLNELELLVDYYVNLFHFRLDSLYEDLYLKDNKVKERK